MKTFMHKGFAIIRIATVGGVLLLLAVGLVSARNVAHASSALGFQAGRIIDDDVFTANSMSVADIQNFLNSKVPVCDTNGTLPASEFGRPDLTHAQYAASVGWPAPPYPCLRDYTENGLSAAQIIYNVGRQFNINPQVLIVLLQKEQGLVTDTWPLPSQYRTATGYGCPDTAACNSVYYGFTNQVTWSGTLFHAVMTGDPNWYSPYVQGNNYIRWNPSSSCGGSTVNITTRATQALYDYTPYQPNQAALNAGYGTGDSCSAYGNRNFYLYFTDWFGSTFGTAYYVCRNGNNIAGAATGEQVVPFGINRLALVEANNTGTACVEAHVWSDSSLQSWSNHIGTNAYTFNPAYSSVSSTLYRGVRLLFKTDYIHTASGRLEVHGWDPTVQQWVSHIASVSGQVDPVSSTVVSADTDGDGNGETYLVNYTGTASGMVEVHGMSSNLQQWTAHVATNLPAIDPTQGKVIAADFNGNGRDELIYVKYAGTQSGRVEFHVWAPGERQWIAHIASNLPTSGFNRATDDIISADIYGRGGIFFVKYSNTGSGRLEVHGWSRDFQYWTSHIATSSGSF